MGRLHVKIFLWFWLGVVIVSGTLLTMTELSHSRGEDDRGWEQKFGPRVDMWSRQQTGVLRREGPAGLERYVESVQSDPGVLNYIFDGEGREVLGRTVPPAVSAVAATAAKTASGTQQIDPVERIIAERIVEYKKRGVNLRMVLIE